MFTENFNSMATQAAVLAGFTTTCLIEITIPASCHHVIITWLHLAATISICANISCVSLATMVSIWGSGKALRGRDGSMDEAVDGMMQERELIFNAFAVGLGGNLFTVMAGEWARRCAIIRCNCGAIFVSDSDNSLSLFFTRLF